MKEKFYAFKSAENSLFAYSRHFVKKIESNKEVGIEILIQAIFLIIAVQRSRQSGKVRAIVPMEQNLAITKS